MIVYWDIDGVLTDFNATFKMKTGVSKADALVTPRGNGTLYEELMVELVKGDFFKVMVPNPDLDYIKQCIRSLSKMGYDNQILSSCGPWSEDNTKTIEGKNAWLEEYGVIQSGISKVNIVPLCTDKEEFSRKGCVLIDDQLDNILQFGNAGGTTYLFEMGDTINTINTIARDLRK